MGPLSALTTPAVKGGALALHDAANRRIAVMAGLALTIVDEVVLLKIARLSVGTHEVAQTAAALLDGRSEHAPDGGRQSVVAGERNAFGGGVWVDAGLEQALASVDIADAHHDIAPEQYLFDRRSALPCLTVQQTRQIGCIERLDPQAAQQGVRFNIAFLPRMPEHRAEAPRVGQAHQLLAELKVEMIMFLRRVCGGQDAQMPGHAEMNDQRAVPEVNQQVFAAPASGQNALPDQQVLQTKGKRPAQATASLDHASDFVAFEMGRDASAGDFDFGQFWHRRLSFCEDSAVSASLPDRVSRAAVERRVDCYFRRKIDGRPQAPRTHRQDSALKNFAAILTLSACLAAAGTAHAASDVPSNAEGLPLIPLSEDLMLKYLSAELAFQRGQGFGAHSALMAMARSTGDPRLARRATEMAIAANSTADAYKGAKLWRELAPRSDEAFQVLLSLQISSNRLDEAKQALAQQLAASTPDKLPTVIATAQRNLSRMPDKTKSVSLLRELLEPYRESVDARLAIAQFSMVSGDRAGALREAKDALAKFPNSEVAALVVAQIVEDKAESIRVLSQFLQKNPKAREVRLAHARLLYEQSKIAEAKKEFKTLVEQKSDDQTALFALGMLSVQANDLPEAEKYLAAYIRALGGQPDKERDATQALMVLAQIAEERNDLATALKWLDQVEIVTHQGSVTAVIKRAQLQAKTGKVDAGRQLLAAADADSDEDRVRLIIGDAQILRDAGRLPEAIKVLEDALESLPENIDLLYEYAMLVEKNKEFEAMEKALRKIIQIAPDNQHAYNALGYSFAERNVRLQEAYDLIKKALQLAPDDAFIIDSMGWVEFRLGRLEKAEELLRRAYTLRPDPEIAVHLGEVLWLRGREEEAKKLWRFANGKDPKNESLKGTLERLQVKL